MNQDKQKRFMASELPTDVDGVTQQVVDNLALDVGANSWDADPRQWYRAGGWAIRDHLTRRWLETQNRFREADEKKVYYLSLEFLIGRSLGNAIINLELKDTITEALARLGQDLEELREFEVDAGLGNGGLGRLAACYLDSMATLGIAGYGYGIRYDYGIFTQTFDAQGGQLEEANRWLHFENVWEMRRVARSYTVHFGGRVVSTSDGDGKQKHEWLETHPVIAVAYDTPVPGNDGKTVNHMRLWAGRAVEPFKLAQFNAGRYSAAVEDQTRAKNLSRILYPDDTTPQGKELRIAQQYFFVSASLQDILRDFLEAHSDLSRLPDKVAIQLNDTHPALAIPELMRILTDEHGLAWEKAWEITQGVFSYTNHTLLPEALEVWPVRMFETLVPRLLHIIYRINRELLAIVEERFPGDVQRLRRMSMIGEDGEQKVRMSHLAIFGSNKTNGVAELHSRLMVETIFKDFYELWPERFTNVTNGVTPRRWVRLANPGLSQLVTERIGPGWENDLERLRELEAAADDAGFREAFAQIKHENKQRLTHLIAEQVGVGVEPHSLFDVQIKRIHEYKRQLLNLLHVVTRYKRLLDDPGSITQPRTVIFSGKAAAGYVMAKQIVKLINSVARTINTDPRTRDMLRMVFIPNYGVTLAQNIIPAADLSEQISTAGMEASGTGNMKFALNGALTIGTLDGANVEMREEIGDEHMFIFGLTSAEAQARRAEGYNPGAIAAEDHELRAVLDMIYSGHFSPYNVNEFKPVVDVLLNHGEHFLVLADYRAYIDAQEHVDARYARPDEWFRSAILNMARMGKFSSDRSVSEYARNIWKVWPAGGSGA